MENKVYLLRYLRKGLVNNVSKDKETVDKTSRAHINVDLKFQVRNVETGESEDKEYSGQEIELLGPADVKGISSKSICRVSPAEIGDVRLNAAYKPYMEFYEEDLPWRYTPFAPESPNFFPWMRLIAVKSDECTMAFQNGVKIARVKLTNDRIAEVFPANDKLANSAHVQIDVPDNENVTFNEKYVNDILNENPDCGISRILCQSTLTADTQYYILLIPTYEQGRLAALGKSIDNVKMNTLVCPLADQELELPIYYKWKCKTALMKGTFKDLADEMRFTSNEEYKAMKANLTVDISNSGLQNISFDKEENIDVPAALVVNDTPYKGIKSEKKEYREKLHEHLLLNPVFEENEANGINMSEDPWVVPPVYGARHLMTTRNDFPVNADKNVVTEVNLKLHNRIPAGMGSSVVRKNQESFVNRAWKKVEVVNALNQMLREYYQMNKVNECAKGKNVRSLIDKKKLTKQNVGLISDAALRMLQTSGIYYNNVHPDTMLEEYHKMEEKDSGVIGSGISMNYLSNLYDTKLWHEFIEKDFKYDVTSEKYGSNKAWEEEGMLDVCFLKDLFETAMIDGKARFIIRDAAKSKLQIIPSSILDSERWNGILSMLADNSNTHDLSNAYNLLNGIKNSFETFNSARLGEANSIGAYQIGSWEYQIIPYPIKVKNGKYITLIVPDDCYEKITINGTVLGKDKPLAIEYLEHKNSKNVSHLLIVPKSYLDNKINPIYYLWYQGVRRQLTVDGNGSYSFVGASNPFIKQYNIVEPTTSKIYQQLEANWQWMKDRNLRLYIEKPKNGEKYEYKDVKPYFQRRIYKSEYQTSIQGKEHSWLKWLRSDETAKKFFSFSDDGKIWYLDINVYRSVIKELIENLKVLKSVAMQPTEVEISLSVDVCYKVSADEFFKASLENFDDDVPVKNETLDSIENIVKAEAKCIDKLNGELKQKTPPMLAADPLDETPIDPDQLAKDRIDELIGKYGVTEYMQLDSRLNDKYPVMVHPDYLDPTFFYLRELSVDYVLPAAGDLAKNSISFFYSNPVFEESFLMGMNTEMGRELMWREYPTDQRGSYFRKFWDQPNLPTKKDLEIGYYDVKNIDTWKSRLGSNHKDNKKPMLVFVIKGNLMQTFPDTEVYLQKKVNDVPKGIIKKADMTSWLTPDTYLVGFSNIKKEELIEYFLAFRQQPLSLQFSEEAKNTYGVVKPQCYFMQAIN